MSTEVESLNLSLSFYLFTTYNFTGIICMTKHSSFVKWNQIKVWPKLRTKFQLNTTLTIKVCLCGMILKKNFWKPDKICRVAVFFKGSVNLYIHQMWLGWELNSQILDCQSATHTRLSCETESFHHQDGHKKNPELVTKWRMPQLGALPEGL